MGCMDITAAAIGLKSAELTSQVQVAVAKKMLDVQKLQGATALKLLQSASSGVAQAGDAMVAAATGLGGSVDAYG
jgi:hypothetical protein